MLIAPFIRFRVACLYRYVYTIVAHVYIKYVFNKLKKKRFKNFFVILTSSFTYSQQAIARSGWLPSVLSSAFSQFSFFLKVGLCGRSKLYYSK